MLAHVRSSRVRAMVSTVVACVLFCLALATGTAHAESPTHSISGTLTLPDGASVDSFGVMWVKAIDVDDSSTWKATQPSPLDGAYVIDGLAPGAYRVEFSLGATQMSQSLPPFVARTFWPNALTWGGAVPIDVSNTDAAGIDHTYEWTGSISGRVSVSTTETTSPNLSKTMVWLRGARGTVFTAQPGATGTWTAKSLPPDTYTVSFSSDYADVESEFYDDAPLVTGATAVVVHERESVRGIDAHLAPWTNVADTLTMRRGNTFYIATSITATRADLIVRFGSATDQAFVGDWDRDGSDSLAVRRGNTFYYSNSLASPGTSTSSFSYGSAGDVVVVGDWDGDGQDTFAVRKGNTFYFANRLGSPTADKAVAYGSSSDQVFVGDWNGDHTDTLGIRRGNTFYLTNDPLGSRAELVVKYGSAGDEILVGDWDGDGIDTFAMRRGNTFYIANSITANRADVIVSYGSAGDTIYPTRAVLP